MQTFLVIAALSGALIYLIQRFVPLKKKKAKSGCDSCGVK